ncbi:hypothetical protein Q3G72_010046 [Acer saccharum]|nr:hypothetical protein Q3G72_010046 [Acer saccharum]
MSAKLRFSENTCADPKKWEKILLKIHAVLDDAGDKQVKYRSVEIWLRELEKLGYDVEDIRDEFATEALRRQMEDQSQASTRRRRLEEDDGATHVEEDDDDDGALTLKTTTMMVHSP